MTATRLVLNALAVAVSLVAEPVKVIGVTDGDTIRFLQDGVCERVRLWGIDAPESGQPFGTRAKQFTSNLAFGKLVTLVIKDTDRYGRTVADVILPDGRSLNRAIVKAGFAWWYSSFAPKEKELARLEDEARRAKRSVV